MELHGASMELRGAPRSSIEFQGAPRSSMELRGAPRGSVELRGAPWLNAKAGAAEAGAGLASLRKRGRGLPPRNPVDEREGAVVALPWGHAQPAPDFAGGRGLPPPVVTLPWRQAPP